MEKWIDPLKKLISPDHLLTEKSSCWAYSYDNSNIRVAPDAVVFAESQEQIQSLVRFCNDFHIPLTARGRGTGTTGGSVPTKGGIVLSLEKMDKILEIDAKNRLACVQPGVINQTLQDSIGEYNLFWPPDPSSSNYCTIGGNLANNSAGPRAIKYGTPRENTLALSAITGSGELLKTGATTTKSVVGLDLTRLLIGSEGTLAIITEATLKILPKNEAIGMLQAFYADIDSAVMAVINIMGQSVVPYTLEFIDDTSIELIQSFSNIRFPKKTRSMLIIEVDGQEKQIADLLSTLEKTANNAGCIEIKKASSAEKMQEIWKTRKALSPALKKVAPKKINEDVVVPIANLTKLISGLKDISEKHTINIVNFGHAGNGNIHVNLLTSASSYEDSNLQKCLLDVFDLVLKLNGTLSGEHGIGIVKRDYIEKELDSNALKIMRSIKEEFDPNNILNPGKALPAE